MSHATVRARYPTRGDVLASYRTSREALLLFVPTDEAIETGSDVRLQVTFGDAPEVFDLEGRVACRVERRRGGQMPGLTVAFVPPGRFHAARMLAFCGGRPTTEATSAAQRVPAQLPVVVRMGPTRLSGCVRDISASGVFVAGEALGEVGRGKEVVLQLTRGWLGLGARRVRAAVVWRGVKYGVRGFGARFLEDPERTGPVLRPLLARRR